MDELADAITVALRGHAMLSVQQEEVEYMAELLVATREDNELLEAAALAPLLVESLEDVAWLEVTKLQEISMEIARVLTGETHEESDELSLEEKMLLALKVEYAIDKSCLAVLEEDAEWHPARIRRHIDDDATGNSAGGVVELTLEVEFIEFGKLQVVSLEEVVLDEDVADDDEDDAFGPGRCEMCEREMRITFHHLTPRDVHAKYLKMGYTREFLNLGIRICRPCHSKIHSTEDNKTLAREYNTLDKILSHPDIARWVGYACKQRSSIKPLKQSKWTAGK